MVSPTSSSFPNALTLSSSSLENKPTPLSLPPSLSSEGPDDLERIFSVSGTSETFLTKTVEAYRPGGLYLVHFGNLFYYEQYKIVRKLGCGAFSTVWLARDTSYT